MRALVERGADIEMDGAVIDGLTAMTDAVAFDQRDAAAYLLELGATVNFWQAAGLGLTDLVAREVAAQPPGEITHAFWVAASNGRRDTAEQLLRHGADPVAPGVNGSTPAESARARGHHDLADWIDRITA